MGNYGVYLHQLAPVPPNPVAAALLPSTLWANLELAWLLYWLSPTRKKSTDVSTSIILAVVYCNSWLFNNSLNSSCTRRRFTLSSSCCYSFHSLFFLIFGPLYTKPLDKRYSQKERADNMVLTEKANKNKQPTNDDYNKKISQKKMKEMPISSTQSFFTFSFS